MERKVVQFQILPAKGKLYIIDNQEGLGYDCTIYDSMIVYLFEDGTIVCNPLGSWRDLDYCDYGGFFIEHADAINVEFLVKGLMNYDHLTYEEACKSVYDYIIKSGIEYSDDTLKKLNIKVGEQTGKVIVRKCYNTIDLGLMTMTENALLNVGFTDTDIILENIASIKHKYIKGIGEKGKQEIFKALKDRNLL